MEREIRISWGLALVFLLLLLVFQVYQEVAGFRLHYMMFQTYSFRTLQDALDKELTIRLGPGVEYIVTSHDVNQAMADSLLNRHFGHTGDSVVVLEGNRSVSFPENLRNAVNQALPPDIAMLDSIYHNLMQGEYPGAQTSVELVTTTDTTAAVHAIRSYVTPVIYIDSLSGKAVRAVIVEPQRVLLHHIIISIAFSALFVILAFVCTGYQLRAVYLQKKANLFILDYFHHIVHQLKSPVAVLGDVMEYARSELVYVDPTWTQQVNLSERSIVKITKMINSILRFSHTGKARMPLDVQYFNLQEAILQAMDELQFKWAAACPRITVVNEMGHPGIAADRLHLCDAVSNLVDNAIKYSPAGVEVVVQLSTKRKYIRIAVKDNGPGIPQVEARHIFEKFFRGSHSTSNGTQGHGLGLSYVQTVCKAHGGRAKVYSTVGKGSEFIMWIPITQDNMIKNGN